MNTAIPKIPVETITTENIQTAKICSTANRRDCYRVIGKDVKTGTFDLLRANTTASPDRCLHSSGWS